MKMIEVMIKLANGEIKDQTTLKIHDPVDTLYTYTFNGKYKSFYSNTEYSRELGDYFKINDNFLNREVELIPPKEKKYLIKLTIKGIADTYLNRSCETGILFLSDSFEGQYSQTKFTKQEMQCIQLVREFLEDMEGKYELIEAGLKGEE